MPLRSVTVITTLMREEANDGHAIADERANRIRVHELLTSVPGIGKAKADDIMRKLGIADNRRVQGLGCRQRELIIELVEKGT